MSLLYQRFADQAARAPDAPALQAGDRQLTMRGFVDLVDTSARQFAVEGLGQGDFMGWLGHNTPEMLAALLACAKLGAVWVPLNWRLAAPELAAIARHAGLSVLLSSPELSGLAGQVRAQVALADPAGRVSADAPGVPCGAQPGDVMLVYTSGTTGEPKGAMHTQAGMLANLNIATAVQGLRAADRVLAVLPLFHVGGLCIQVLPALACGAVVKLHTRFEPGAWLHDVASWRPTTSLLVPAVMQALHHHPGWAAADLGSLRYLNSGSQVVPVALIEAFHARGVPVAQVYGSTETGPFSIALQPGEALAHVGQVGRPAPGVQLRLVAAAGHERGPGEVGDVGEVGEIWLQAPNLMRGYHRLPPGAGFVDAWFATGDLASADADGWVTVVGRSQELIISGGENIYPAELENLAATWPGVAEAAVVGLPDARWGEVPVLVLVAQAGAVVDLDGLRWRIQQQLARFKHPRAIVLKDELPRTALGKVQKAQLLRQLLCPPA